MSRRQLRTDDEAGFIRAFWDETMDLVQEEGVRVEWLLQLPVRTRSLELYGVAYKKDANGDEQFYAAFRQPYPTPSAARLHAALYRAAVRLSIEVRDTRRAIESEEQLTH
jgi:hypothetical protein